MADITKIELVSTDGKLREEFDYGTASTLLSWRSSGWCLPAGGDWEYNDGKLSRIKKAKKQDADD